MLFSIPFVLRYKDNPMRWGYQIFLYLFNPNRWVTHVYKSQIKDAADKYSQKRKKTFEDDWVTGDVELAFMEGSKLIQSELSRIKGLLKKQIINQHASSVPDRIIEKRWLTFCKEHNIEP